MSRDYLGTSSIVYIYNLNVSIRYRCFSDSFVVCRDAEEGEHLRLENRSSSESGYGTSVGDTRGDIMGDIMDIRGDTRHQDTDLDEVFYLEEEEEGFPLQHFNSDKSHICVGQYKQ